jgi:hypothetical protein
LPSWSGVQEIIIDDEGGGRNGGKRSEIVDACAKAKFRHAPAAAGAAESRIDSGPKLQEEKKSYSS